MKKLVYLGLFCAVILAGILMPRALAQRPLTSSTGSYKNIASNCARAQDYLNSKLRSRDLRARVDRLQAYQYTYQRVDGFVKRLERHDQPRANSMRITVTRLNDLINDFKTDYELYDAARDKLSSLADCQKQPEVFSRQLKVTRGYLGRVEKHTKAIDEILKQQLIDELFILKDRFESVNE